MPASGCGVPARGRPGRCSTLCAANGASPRRSHFSGSCPGPSCARRWRRPMPLSPAAPCERLGSVRWRPLLGRLLPEHEIRYWPEIGDRAAIEYALVWQPEPGLLASLPNLKLIVGLGAGVDHLLVDPLLPKAVPIVRLVDPYMTDAMSEYVVLSVLRLHRQDLDYLATQRAG